MLVGDNVQCLTKVEVICRDRHWEIMVRQQQARLVEWGEKKKWCKVNNVWSILSRAQHRTRRPSFMGAGPKVLARTEPHTVALNRAWNRTDDAPGREAG